MLIYGQALNAAGSQHCIVNWLNFSYLYIGYHAFKTSFLPDKRKNTRRGNNTNKHQEQKRDLHAREK